MGETQKVTEPELRIGQVWQEVDPRFCRTVEIVGFIGKDHVRIKHVRISTAQRIRFNGKRGGYKFIKDAP